MSSLRRTSEKYSDLKLSARFDPEQKRRVTVDEIPPSLFTSTNVSEHFFSVWRISITVRSSSQPGRFYPPPSPITSSLIDPSLLPHISFLHRSSLLPSIWQQYMSQPLRHISPLIHSNSTASQLRSTLCFSATVQVHVDHCFSSTLRNQSSTFSSITFN